MASTMRSVAPFFRAARSSLGRNPTNPLVSLQRQSRTPAVNLARTYATYERTKPHVNIGMPQTSQLGGKQLLTPLPTGTIGHVDHGKVR
jgi:elongation factor Tu